MLEMPNYGQVAYEAYSVKTGGKSLVSGDRLPSWDDLPEQVQVAWEAAAQAVIDAEDDDMPALG
jgi:hypothetical protein